MMGSQGAGQAPLFYAFNLEDHIPGDHLLRGIDRDKGCMVVVRPDQYIAHVLPLDGYGELAAFFAAFLR